MTELPIEIPYLYTAEVVRDGVARRVVAASSVSTTIPVLPVPTEEFKVHVALSPTVAGYCRDGVLYNRSFGKAAADILDIRRGGENKGLVQDVDHELIGGVELVLHLKKAYQALPIATAEDLASMDVLSDNRDVVAARTLRLASLCFSASNGITPGSEPELWTPLRDAFVGRDPYDAAVKPAQIWVSPFDRWRTLSSGGLRGGPSGTRAPRLMAFDRDYDPTGLFEKADREPRILSGGDRRSAVPEAAMNNLAFARSMLSIAGGRAVGRRVPYAGREAMAVLHDVVEAYQDVLSPPPPTVATAETLLRCANVLVSRSGELSLALEAHGTIVEDARWFSGYWDKRGPAMAATEGGLPSLGYAAEHRPQAPEPASEADMLSMGI